MEGVWGKPKQYTQAHCNYSFRQLENTVGPSLDSVSVSLIRKYFRKTIEPMKAYSEGHTGHDAFNIAKQYKSHRRVSETESY